MQILDVLAHRRSVRKYTDKAVCDELIEQILKAGLLSPSSRARYPWEFIVVCDPKRLEAMSECRTGSADMLKNAAFAIAVIADESVSDVWIEDCSVAMAYMHLTADALGLGSCWIQLRSRQAQNGKSSEEFLREILNFPPNFKALAILSVGVPDSHPSARSLENLKTQKIHRETF